MSGKNNFVLYEEDNSSGVDGTINNSDLGASLSVINDQDTLDIWNGYVENLKFLLEELLPHVETITIDKEDGPFYRGRVEGDKGPYIKARDLKAPPTLLSKVGRINPIGLSFLYVADTIDTALQELHQEVGKVVSIAKCVPNRDLKLLNLTHDIKEDKKTNSFRRIINERFSTPINYENPVLEYLPTQVIAIYVKDVMEYDGIKYQSSINKDGYNIVLFDDDDMNFSYYNSYKI
ncbi:RES family NAD+ phosphorylase [Paenibacillus sp. RC73]|uniref:RES family NAD+ phosphorylase n=1 Tax=Paenibacillus sp. RC73 TaxID=3156250 RepID=UPI00384D146D